MTLEELIKKVRTEVNQAARDNRNNHPQTAELCLDYAAKLIGRELNATRHPHPRGPK